MKISQIKVPIKALLLLVLVLQFNFFPIKVEAATTATSFTQSISAGTLGVSIVDGSGNVVGSPSINFSAGTFSFNTQTTTGILGTSTQKVRLDNPTATVTWTISLAATGGDSAVWSNGSSLTYPYNNATQASGQLAIDPSVGTITPWSGCTNTNLSKGSADHFVVTTKSSITILTAASGANPYCRWDLTGVNLSQTIPASQAVANYTLGMTITAL